MRASRMQGISGGRLSPPKNSVRETELQNDLCDVQFLAN